MKKLLINFCPAKVLLCVVMGLLTSANVQAQDNLHFERYTIEEGLSTDRVNDIIQDQLGYIWIATESGLNRYDGYDFTVYSNIPGDPTSLSNNFTNVVFVDSYGQVWAGTNSGLNRYDSIEDSFKIFSHDQQDQSTLAGNIVREVYESKRGELWIGTNNGLSVYDQETGSFINQWDLDGGLIDFSGIEVTSIAEDKTGKLWIGSLNRGLITFDPQKKVVRYFDKDPIPGITFPTTNVSNVYVDTYGQVWIAFFSNDISAVFLDSFYSQSALVRLDPENDSFTLFKHDPETQPEFWEFISDITETQDSTLWVTSYFNNELSGVHQFDRESERFKLYTHDPSDSYSLTWQYTTAIYEDRLNNLWVGTSRGLNKADLSKWIMNNFEFRPDAPELLLDNYYGIEEVQDNIFWLGLDGTGLIQWDRNTGETIHFGPENPYSGSGTNDISSGNMSVLKKDHNGEIWIGYSGNGIARVDPETKEYVRYSSDPNNENALSGDYVTGIIVDSSNTVWISTSYGLSRYNRESDTFTSWTTENSKLPSNSLSTIFQDSRGTLWLGTRNHTYDTNSSGDFGLIKFDPKSEATVLYQNDRLDVNSLSNDAINVISEDSEGYLWIGTNNGLNRFNMQDESFLQYHVKDGLPGTVIVGMLFDDDGNLWLSTLKGLSRFDPESGSFRNYGKDDGIQENRYNDYSHYKAADGELIFGGTSGANYFYPSESFEVSNKPLINLTGVLVNNEPFNPGTAIQDVKELALGWDQNSVGFEFTAINFRAPDKTRYEYKLDGYDEEWLSSDSRRFVNYTNLAADKYTFNVRAINEDGETSAEPASLSFVISPPVWNTWGAYAVYFLLLCGAVLGVDRIQRRRVLFKEKERAREKELKQAKKIEEAYRELERSHKDLKSAQAQLVQQEKLASLGQLTAGIAHEIKNPLNFVNNFSDLSIELIDEVREEIASLKEIHESPQRDEINAILDDIEANLKKIHEHGSRADSIVKSMLEHSRGGSGEMEPTDLNSLIKEYVNLSFHGMRAGKDAINVDIDLELSDSVGDVPLVAEDFSRVILNLTNNAFDAMRERQTGDRGPKTDEDYQPKLAVRTYSKGDHVIVEIEDNGPGIPDEIKDKILQPFFTTKKGTQGTGLGLSITNDIIKAHGGSLDVHSQPGQSTFIIQLNA